MPAEWFDAARLGMFVHWGYSSQRGCQLSWPMVGGRPALPQCGPLPVAEYQSTAATFDPKSFDGLEPWQFYGPSTRKGDTVFLHLLMRPYETVTVRGVPIRRVRSIRALADGRELAFDTRCAILDQLLNSDPMGELTISVPEDVLDPLATVLAIEIAPNS